MFDSSTTDGGTHQERLAQVLIKKANGLLQAGEIDKAIVELDEAYRQAPHLAAGTYARVLMMRGAAKEQRNNLIDSLADYRAALAVTAPGGLHDEIVAVIDDLTAKIQASGTPHTSLPRCPQCRRDVEPQWVSCPYCGFVLQGTTSPRKSISPGRPKRRAWLWGMAVTLALLIGTGFLLMFYQAVETANRQAQATATAQAQVQATRTSYAQETRDAASAATVQALSTQQAQQTIAAGQTQAAQTIAAENTTQTVIANKTATSQTATAVVVQATASVQAQMHETVRAIAEKQRQVFGPNTGQMRHINDERPEGTSSNANLRNFITQVRFSNPYEGSTQHWDYGIQFRTIEEGAFVLSVSSDKVWELALHRTGSSRDKIAGGRVELLNHSAGGSNELKLYVTDTEAYFFLNNTFISVLDVSGQQETGDVLLIIEYYPFPPNIEQAITHYENWVIWSIP